MSNESIATNNTFVTLKTNAHTEIIRKLPEIELINDDTIRQHTIDALATLTPEYFWTVPAASTYKHHNPYSCDKHGLWIHTKMVFTAYDSLVRSWVQQDKLSKTEADWGRAACLLHDIHKNGTEDTPTDCATKDHDLTAAEAIKDDTELPEPVATAVAEHMGPWYDGPTPETTLGQLVHTADMMASSKNITPGIYKPAEELQEYYPSIPRASL